MSEFCDILKSRIILSKKPIFKAKLMDTIFLNRKERSRQGSKKGPREIQERSKKDPRKVHTRKVQVFDKLFTLLFQYIFT